MANEIKSRSSRSSSYTSPIGREQFVHQRGIPVGIYGGSLPFA